MAINEQMTPAQVDEVLRRTRRQLQQDGQAATWLAEALCDIAKHGMADYLVRQLVHYADEVRQEAPAGDAAIDAVRRVARI